jgi:hypothetical protein
MPLWEQSTPVEDQEPQPYQWQSSTPVGTAVTLDAESAANVYDTSTELDLPINEAENLYAATPDAKGAKGENLVVRFGKQLYNSTIGHIVTMASTESNLGRIATDIKLLENLEEDFYARVEQGLPVDEDRVLYYVSPRRVLPDGEIQMRELDERAFRVLKAYRQGQINLSLPGNAKDQIEQFAQIQQATEQQRFEQADVTLQVKEAENVAEKVTDAAAGIAGFVAQIAALKKVAPSMPEWMVWEQINLANGGSPGEGAAMQLTLGGIGKAIPGPGFTPALARGATTSALFGTSTYFGGGDTEEILINMGIPFAFEGVGLTRQSWARYKNKKAMIQTIKDKAPALKGRPDIEVDAAISKLLNDSEMIDQFAPRERPASLSKEVVDYMARQRYDVLLEKANAGDKTAIRQLNEYVQGTNLPTYDQLLQRGFEGDPTAFDTIVSGEYYGGRNQNLPELKLPKQKPVGAKAPVPKPLKAPSPERVAREVYMKGFAARLTSIRNNADNLIAKAGKKKTQLKTMKDDLKAIEDHYRSVSDTIGRSAKDLPELVQIKKLLPDYSKAVNEFTAKPSKEGFEQIKNIGDQIADLSTAFGQRFNTAQAKAMIEEPYTTPIEQMRQREVFAANADTRPGSLSKADLKKARERGFITSAKEIYPELRVEGQYVPRPTDPLAIKNRNLIIDDIARAEQLARSGMNDKAVSMASELVKYYGDKGRSAKTPAEADLYFEKAATIANDIAVTLTEAGRTVQAASILGRLTPEGQVRYAAREIQKYNEKVSQRRGSLGGLQKQIPELTGKQAKYILEEMDAISKMPEGKAKNVRFFKLQNYIADLVPSSLYRKIVTVWKAGLLTGFKTHGVNIFSNAAHLSLEAIKDIPATAVDKIASYFTGKRTVAPTVKGLGSGTIEGLENSIEYIKTGYSERNIGTKLDIKRTNFGKSNTGKALNMYTEGIFRTLGAEDQPFYYAAKMRSMYEQAKVSAINQRLKGPAAQKHIDYLLENPTEQMIKNATLDAETAVYINQTALGDFARSVQRLPGGEIIVPFGRTPSAVAMQVVNYSPVGIAKTIIENIGQGRFDQRAFSKGVGRGLTGTAIIAIGAALYDNGLINLDRPKNEKERKLQELEGRTDNSIKIDNQWRSIQSLGPAGNLLIIGGHFKRAFDENGSPSAAMAEALGGSAKSFTEQTFLKGVNQFVDALSDPERSANYVAGSTISSIIPVFVSDVARATDVYERRADSIAEKVLVRIPGARRTLEPSINVLGQRREPTANPIEIMFDATRPSMDISTPVVTELRRLWDLGWEASPNLLGGREGYDILTPEENTALWEQAGDLTKQGLTTLIEAPGYAQLVDEQKAEVIASIISQAQTAAKTQAVIDKLTGLEGDELNETIFEMRRQGLATEAILPIALSKRNPRKALKEQKEQKQ